MAFPEELHPASVTMNVGERAGAPKIVYVIGVRDLAITFAGGGSRAFYQVGFLEEHLSVLQPRIASVAACSAGSAMATLLLAGRAERAKAFFAEARVGVRGHFSMRRLLARKRPFPHNEIYRATMLDALQDGGFERIRALPFPVKILCATFPRVARGALGIAAGLGVYQLEKRLKPRMVHPSLPQRIGFQPRAWDARQCETPEELVELVLSSSSTPPFTTVGRFSDLTLIDGSMVDNAPAFLAEEEPGVSRSLVLLTRPHHPESVGRKGKRLYVAPETPLPITRWDYTEHAPVEETIERGRRDAARVQSELAAFLSEGV
ncbi:MAG: patatin-like phospholipase family protein [Myxococcota bacterium]